MVSLASITTKIGSGATPRGGGEVYLAKRAQYALVRSQNVFDRRFDTTGLAFITDEQARELRGVALQADDVLLNITGDGITFGRACIVPKSILPACVNQHVAIIRVDPSRAVAGYVLSFLTHPEVKPYIESYNAGGSRRAITKGHIENFFLPLPPINTQRVISDILGTLDAKIELNRQMNESLEAMGRALFKSWFVDFDPVRAKSEGRETGLPSETDALFPAALQESEIGRTPAGWPITAIGDLAEIVGGGTPDTRNSEYWDNGIYSWATPKDLSVLDAPVLFSTDRRISEEGMSQLGSGLLPIGTVLISSRAPIGYLAVAETPVAINQGLIALKSSDAISNLYLLYWAASAAQLISSRANGSTFLEISKANFRALPLIFPGVALVQKFDESVRPLYLRMRMNIRENAYLTSIRDLLLPKLISGELLAGRDQ